MAIYLSEWRAGGLRRAAQATCDLLRVKDVKIGEYLSFQGAFAAFAA
jgi:hypothetical protein